LAFDQSAELRDRLVAEVDALQSADEAASWAHRNLPAKNTLTTADADLVESGFRATLAAFGDSRSDDGLREAVPSPPAARPGGPNPEAEAPLVAAPGEASFGGVHHAGKTIRLGDQAGRRNDRRKVTIPDPAPVNCTPAVP
jgi:hypothetical protein